MKKISLIILMPIILASCKNNSPENYENLRFVVPTGAPAVAMSYFADLENFETITDPSKILPMMVAGQVDVAVLPTNVGITAIHDKKIPYKILGTVTFGNFYIASTGNDKDGVMDENDYIVSFQQGAVPDKIFHYIHNNSLDNALHYVSSAQEAAKCLKLGINLADDNASVDYVVIAEPALTTVMSTTQNVSLYENLQDSYKVKSGGLSIYQASVFIKNTINHDQISEKLEDSINKMKSTENVVKNYMNKIPNPEIIFGVKPDIAQNLTINGNKLGIGFEKASLNKDGINLFLSIFGVGELTDEDIA